MEHSKLIIEGITNSCQTKLILAYISYNHSLNKGVHTTIRLIFLVPIITYLVPIITYTFMRGAQFVSRIHDHVSQCSPGHRIN